MHKYFRFLIIALSFTACKRSKKPTNLSSAQPNVIVIEQEFEILKLNRSRKIRIYLPKNYWESEEKYPVIYMHDGQSLFDNATSDGEEWSVDESLNQLSDSFNFNLIVVGIDSGPKRMNEFSPWDNKKYGKGEGEEYMEFIVNQIKPFIDSTYKTLPNRENTAIMGASMGGFISHYAIYKYPDIFSKAGLLSASYWFSDKVYDFTLKNPIPKDSRLFLIAGKKEGYDNVLPNYQKMFNTISRTGHSKKSLNYIIDPEGKHNIASWKKQFVPAVKWLFNQ